MTHRVGLDMRQVTELLKRDKDGECLSLSCLLGSTTVSCLWGCLLSFSRVSSFKVFRCSAAYICRTVEVYTVVVIDVMLHCNTESYQYFRAI